MPNPGTGRVFLPRETGSSDDIANRLDAAWSALSHATSGVVDATSAALFAHIREHVPDVREVWVRMDTSHEPAHGHLDGIFTRDNHDILPEVHDDDWIIEAEEFAWDLGHVGPMHFVRHDTLGDTRRLIISVDNTHDT